MAEQAEQGLPDAQYSLGNAYYNGDGVAEDVEVAMEWYRKAAEQGQADAQQMLGDLANDGEVRRGMVLQGGRARPGRRAA